MAIHKFTRLLCNGEPVPVFGDGSSARDYTFIEDIVEGTVRAIERCQGYHIYNLGGSRTVTLLDLVKLLSVRLGVEPRVKHLPQQAGDVPITFADISRARNELGYEPTTPIEKGLDAFVDWFSTHRQISDG